MHYFTDILWELFLTISILWINIFCTKNQRRNKKCLKVCSLVLPRHILWPWFRQIFNLLRYLFYLLKIIWIINIYLLNIMSLKAFRLHKNMKLKKSKKVFNPNYFLKDSSNWNVLELWLFIQSLETLPSHSAAYRPLADFEVCFQMHQSTSSPFSYAFSLHTISENDFISGL